MTGVLLIVAIAALLTAFSDYVLTPWAGRYFGNRPDLNDDELSED